MSQLRFIVNVASGGRLGRAVLADLQRRFGPERAQHFVPQALDALLAACHRDRAALIACGGDGTVAAALEASVRSGTAVPVGVLPLGTGNDLARILRWPLRPRWDREGLDISVFTDAVSLQLDRWTITGGARGEFTRGWYNYLSLGYDARVASRFHALRRHHPRFFRSVLFNRALYGLASFSESPSPLGGALRLHDAHPEPLRLPAWATALLFTNIPSYAGGVQLGRGIRSDDGLLEAFALPTVVGLSLALGRLRRLRMLGATTTVGIEVKRALMMQIDGEPLLATPGDYTIARGGSVMLLTPRTEAVTSR